MKKATASSILVAAVLLTVAVVAQAQQPAKIPRIALLVPSTAAGYASRVEAFRRALGNLGYIEGKNIVVEYRYTDGRSDQVSRFLSELIGLHVDVIVTSSTSTVLRTKKATQTIPIVFVGIGDPVANGVVDSLARPGSNLTGLSNLAPDLGGKRLELLKEVVPRLSRVAILLWNREGSGTAAQLKELEVAARALNLTVQRIDIAGPSAADLERALKAVTTGRPQALLAAQSPTFAIFRGRIADFAITSHLPAMYGESSFPEAGGLLSYGASSLDLFRRAATYVDRILKGAKPADLPVEQPMKVEFVINLKTAKKIGLTIPQSVLYRADKVIQ